MTEPAACSTAWLTKFSDAISSRPEFCRCCSFRIASAMSGSVAISVRQREGVSVVDISGASFNLGDLIDAALVAAALEGRAQPQRDNFIRQSEGHDPAADGEHVGVVVLARHARGVEIVAERGADSAHLVRRDLFPLAAAADDDAAVGVSGSDQASDLGADRRVVDGCLVVRAAIVDAMAEPRQRDHHVFLERKPRMVGADRDAHKMRLYAGAGCWVLGARCSVLVLGAWCLVRNEDGDSYD